MDLITDPAELERESAFLAAKESAAQAIRNTPDERIDVEDTIDLMLVQAARASYVRFFLLNGDEKIRGEQEGVIDISIKAPISFPEGKVLSPQEAELKQLGVQSGEMRLGAEWSEFILSQLPIDQRIMALRHAYSLRSQKLWEKIAEGKNGILVLQERFHALEERCRQAISHILS